MIEVHEAHLLTLAPVAAILFQRDAKGQRGVDRAVRFDQTGRLHARDRAHRLVHVVVRDPSDSAASVPPPAAHQHDLAQAVALGLQDLRRHIGIPKLLNQLNRRNLRSALLHSTPHPTESCRILVGSHAKLTGEEDGHEGASNTLSIVQYYALGLDSFEEIIQRETMVSCSENGSGAAWSLASRWFTLACATACFCSSKEEGACHFGCYPQECEAGSTRSLSTPTRIMFDSENRWRWRATPHTPLWRDGLGC